MKFPKWVDWACRWCGVKKVHITDEGETYDGGDDWYDYHCINCGKYWRAYTEYD